MRIQIRYGWHFDSRAERLQDTTASGTAGNQPPHRTRNASNRVCAVPLFEHTSVRPRRSASTLPPAHRTYCPLRGSRDVLSPVFKAVDSTQHCTSGSQSWYQAQLS